MGITGEIGGEIRSWDSTEPLKVLKVSEKGGSLLYLKRAPGIKGTYLKMKGFFLKSRSEVF
jgi:hypothetical protein